MEISDSGILTYRHGSCREETFAIEVFSNRDNRCLCILPLYGDLLTKITVLGFVESAELYQYAFDGSTKIVYDSICSAGVITPFPNSGFPILNCRKNLYLAITIKSGCGVRSIPKVSATYVYLPDTERKLLATSVGIKVKNASGKVYKVYGSEDLGFEPNFLGLSI